MHLQQSRIYHKKTHTCAPVGVSKRSISSFMFCLNLDIFCYPLVAFISVFFVSTFGQFTDNELAKLVTYIPKTLRHSTVSCSKFRIQYHFSVACGLFQGLWQLNRNPTISATEIKTKAQYYSNDPSYIHLWKSNISGEMFLKLFQYKPLKSLGPCTNRYHTDICETFATDTILISVRHFRDGIKRYL